MRRFILTTARTDPPMAFASDLTVARNWVASGGQAFDTVEHRWVAP